MSVIAEIRTSEYILNQVVAAQPAGFWISGNGRMDGTLQIGTIAHLATATDKILVSDGGLVKYRTASEILSDVGGVPSTRLINTIHSIQGGGNLTADRTLSLVGDVASPGNNMLYSTNGSGVRGWNTLSILGIGTVTSITFTTPLTGGTITNTGVVGLAGLTTLGSANQIVGVNGAGTGWEYKTPAALTKTDDTNVTLTLGGSPSTALLAATSLTLGWTGVLAVSRGGTGNSSLTAMGVLYGNGSSSIQTVPVNASGTNKFLTQSNSNAPAWNALTTTDLIGIVPISILVPAIASNTINNGNYFQEWQWNSLNNSSGGALKLSSNSTVGTAQTLFDVRLSGAFASANGIGFSGVFISNKTGTNSTNNALYAEASSGTNNTGLTAIGAGGQWGTSPGYSIYAQGRMRIDGQIETYGFPSGGVIIKPANSGSVWTFTLPNSAGTNNYVLITDGAGVTSWANPATIVSGSFIQNQNASAQTASFWINGNGRLNQLTLDSIPHATIDTDKFIVSDGGVIKYRTGAEMLSDIGVVDTNFANTNLTFTTNVFHDLGNYQFVLAGSSDYLITLGADNSYQMGLDPNNNRSWIAAPKGLTFVGDWSGAFNSTYLEVDDDSRRVRLRAFNQFLYIYDYNNDAYGKIGLEGNNFSVHDNAGIIFYADPTHLAVHSSGISGTFYTGSITANRTWTFPDRTGNVALNPLTTLGDIIYSAASGVETRLAGNITTTRKFLRQTGTGSVSAAPVWDTLLASDIPTGSSNYIQNQYSSAQSASFWINGNGRLAQLTLDTIPNASTDTDKFLVSDGGVIKYRTGTQVVSDITSELNTANIYIKNQFASEQTADFNISGRGRVVTQPTGNYYFDIGRASSGVYNRFRVGSDSRLRVEQDQYAGIHYYGASTYYGGITHTTLNGVFSMSLFDGSRIGYLYNTPSTRIYAWDVNNVEKMRLDANGYLLIGQNSSIGAYVLQSKGNSSFANKSVFWGRTSIWGLYTQSISIGFDSDSAGNVGLINYNGIANGYNGNGAILNIVDSGGLCSVNNDTYHAGIINIELTSAYIYSFSEALGTGALYRAKLTQTNTLGRVFGFYADIQRTASEAGHNTYGAYINVKNYNDTGFGIRISTTNYTGGTGPCWAVYAEAGKNHFQDEVLIGTTTNGYSTKLKVLASNTVPAVFKDSGTGYSAIQVGNSNGYDSRWGVEGAGVVSFKSGVGDVYTTFLLGHTSANISLGTPSSWDGSNTMNLVSGTSPTTSITDGFRFYSKDIVAGNAAPHFRTEAGDIVKLYKHAAVTTAQGIADALTDIGLLATSTITTTDKWGEVAFTTPTTQNIFDSHIFNNSGYEQYGWIIDYSLFITNGTRTGVIKVAFDPANNTVDWTDDYVTTGSADTSGFDLEVIFSVNKYIFRIVSPSASGSINYHVVPLGEYIP